MSVSIFGSSSKSNNTTKNYVDSKYISIIKNVNTKVDKGGDSMKGTLDMGNFKISNLHDPEVERDAVNKKYVDKLLETKRDKSEILSNTGTQDVATKSYVNSGEELAKIYTDSRETATRLYIDSRESIVRTYIDNRDAETRVYVNNKYIKNSVGLIPDLTTIKRNKSGFIITAAGTAEKHYPWLVFNSSKGDCQFLSFPTQEEKWIKIKCPEPIKIHKFTIRGIESKPATDDKAAVNVGKITNWLFQGSIDNNAWVDLYNGHMVHIDYEFKTFQIPSNAESYIYYRFSILQFTGENLGLNHLQIYSAIM